MNTQNILFKKMEGLGNDFIIPDSNANEMVSEIIQNAVFLCDRRRGIGADGIIFILPSDKADFKMRIINSDGSEPEMCGNGIRCCAKYIQSNHLSEKNELTIETKAGIIGVKSLGNDLIKVNMGQPVLEAPLIPVQKVSGRVIMEEIIVDGASFKFTAVSMGNPHAILYPDTIDDDLVLGFGPLIEKHQFFPKKTNVEFIKVISDNEISMRVWERGCGETMACGTGACASVVSGILNKKHKNDVTVHLPGGDLFVQWSGIERDSVFMTGPAKFVFSGQIEIEI